MKDGATSNAVQKLKKQDVHLLEPPETLSASAGIYRVVDATNRMSFLTMLL
jgi:hypothetical protein